MTSEFFELFTYWSRFRDFGLPLGGCWMDYPNMFIQTLELFNAEWRSAGGNSR